jgi:hypothetical protein
MTNTKANNLIKFLKDLNQKIEPALLIKNSQLRLTSAQGSFLYVFSSKKWRRKNKKKVKGTDWQEANSFVEFLNLAGYDTSKIGTSKLDQLEQDYDSANNYY